VHLLDELDGALGLIWLYFVLSHGDGEVAEEAVVIRVIKSFGHVHGMKLVEFSIDCEGILVGV